MIRLILAAALAAAPALSANADPIPLSDLSDYLNGIGTAEASFTQISEDGAIATGTLYLHRPGRMRFEYDEDDLLVMAGGGQVAIFDGRANSRPEQYPLRRTPLNLILGRNIDLDQSSMILSHEEDESATRVVAQDPEEPEIGTIELVFTGDPVELRQWVVTDSTEFRTTVILGGLEEGGDIPSRYFNIPLELRDRGLSD
ncbi:outer membrane lipoprotein carrier protein LolA [Rhodobacteraceae bacterium W635]|uniref:LolA family protein n=1 Tax=Nioella halotolerans TaxID=2303578 RepID=UPI000E3C4652|nr:outer membrane lipoprotein carrier protein LolA [Rhodobacteraceae bacterium W635]